MMNNLKSYAPNILRIGMSLVILWFGSQQLMHPSMWTGFLPGWVSSLPLTPITFIYLNGWLEIITGILLLIGLFTRVVGIILALHLLGIVFSVGYTATSVRDFGLTIALVSIFLNGEDAWSLDRKL